MSKIWKNAKYLILLRNPVQTAQTGQLRRPKLPSPHRDEFLDVPYVELLGGFLDRCVDVDLLDGLYPFGLGGSAVDVPAGQWLRLARHNVLRATAGGDACNPVSQEHRRPSTKLPTDASG